MSIARNRRRPSHILLLIAASSALAIAGNAQGATKLYDGTDGGTWSLSTNWNNNTTPVAGDDVTLGTFTPGGGVVNVNVSMNVTYNAAPLNSLTLNSSGLTGAMILNQTAANTHMQAVAVNLGTTSPLNTYNHSAGLDEAYTLNIGVASTGNTYNLSGTGQLKGSAVYIGVSGSGLLNQSGGSNEQIGGFLSPSEMDLGVNAGSSGTYTLSGGTVAVDIVQIGRKGSGTFNQSGGTANLPFLFVGADAGTGVYNLSGTGTLKSSITVGAFGTFNFSGGTLNSSVVVNSGGLFNFLNGVYDPEAELNVDGAAHLNGRNVTLGTLTGNTGIVESGSGNAVLTLGSSNAAATSTFKGVIQNGNASIVSVVKNGTFTQVLGGQNTYSGPTTVNAGVLKLGAINTLPAASAVVVNGGTLDLANFDQTIPSLSGTGGTIDVGTAALTISGNGSATFSGGLAGAGTLNKAGTGQLTLNGGGLFSGTINVSAGSLRSTSSFGFPANANINLSGLGTSLNVNASQSIASLAGGVLTTVNFSSSLLTVGNATNSSTTFYGSFTGIGTFIKAGVGTLTLGNGSGDNLNSNTNTGLAVSATGGLLILNKADGTNALGGAITINNGAIRLARSNQIANTSPLTLLAGNFDLNGFSETIGTLNGAGGAINPGGGTLTVTQATNDSFAGQLNGTGTFVKAGAADLTVSNIATFSGAVASNGGKLIVTGSVNAGSIVANNGGTIRFNANALNLSAGDLRANAGGTIEYAGASITNGYLRGAGAHTIVAGSTSSFSGVASFNSTIINQNGPATLKNFTNGGTFNNNVALSVDGVVNAGSGVLNVNNTVSATDFSSAGVINLGGTLQSVGGNIVLSGGSRTNIAAGGTLLAPAGSTVELNGGLLVNNGNVIGTTNVNYGSLAKGVGSYGVVHVNDGGIYSPGVAGGSFSIVDAAAFANGSTLAIDLGGSTQGTQYDSVVSADTAAVSGTLTLTLLNGYVPAYGVQHHIVTSVNTASGIFQAVTGVKVNADHWLAVTYGTNVINVTAALPGDADLSGTVDFDDLLMLAKNYGQTTGRSWSLGDFDGTGGVDFNDLLALAKFFNQSIASPGSAELPSSIAADWILARTLVPEPSLSLLGLAVATLFKRRR